MNDPHPERILEGEVVTEETGTALAIRETQAPATLFNTDDPKAVITKATEVADVLKDVVVKKQLVKKIGQSEYILVEGWTTLGALVGVFPKVEYTREVDEGWEAAVIVVNGNGVEIGRAEAQCLRSERNWKSRDDFAVRSMAQTRAMGKALRMPLGWIAVLAGYEATPAEEMPDVVPGREDPPFEASPAAESARSGGASNTGPAQGSGDDGNHGHASATGTGGASDPELEAKVTELLELTARVSVEAHDATVDAIAKRREAGQLTAQWLGSCIRAAKAKLPAEEPKQESAFTIPESARA